MQHQSHPTRLRRKQKLAAAIRWTAGQDGPPRIVASGTGPLAERILAIASEQAIPIAADTDLAEVLARIEPGTSIPPETFVAVAALLGPLLRLQSSTTTAATAGANDRTKVP